MLYNSCTGIYKFGNNTYPRRIRRRSNLSHIFRGKVRLMDREIRCSFSSRHSGRRHIYAHSISSCVLRSPPLHNRIVHFSMFYHFRRPFESCHFVQLLSSALFFGQLQPVFIAICDAKPCFTPRTGEIEKLGN
jgi:hypothetical protein